MGSQLILHRGGHLVPEEELKNIPTPGWTSTWYPKPHHELVSSIKAALQGAGYEITRQQLAVSHEGLRLFGTLDLSAPLSNGVTMAVGLRNSNDRTFPIGFMCGQRCSCCDNLAFTSEIVVSKKHTRFAEYRFLEELSSAVATLPSYQTSAAAFIENLQGWDLSPQQADSIILRAYESGLIGPRLLPDLIDEWRHPSHEEFKPQTGWSLWNCFTEVLKRKQETQPAQAAITTIRLQALLSPPKELIYVNSTNLAEAS